MNDPVTKPSHYMLFDDIESIAAIAALMTQAEFKAYCFGNALKYRFRAGRKNDIKQDIDKANYYEVLYFEHKYMCQRGISGEYL